MPGVRHRFPWETSPSSLCLPVSSTAATALRPITVAATTPGCDLCSTSPTAARDGLPAPEMAPRTRKVRRKSQCLLPVAQAIIL